MSNCLYQTVEEIVTEISISQDSTPWLVVEGVSDVRFFSTRKLPNSPKCVIAFGWANVVSVISKVTEENIAGSIVGFIDRDHREDVGIAVDYENIVATDYRDLEISMFESGALHRILVEFGSSHKLPKLSCGTVNISLVRSCIYEIAEALGRFRYYSLKNDLNIKFKGIDYSKFINKETLSLDPDKLINQINSKSDSKVTKDDFEVAQHCLLPERLSDSKNLNSGHDVIEIFGISLRKVWGSNNTSDVNRETLEASFRIGYSDEELEGTNMYKKLCGVLSN